MDFLFIGTSGWTYRHWKGDFYPHDLPVSQWFSHYCSQFNAVEINATFYHRFKDATFLKWYGIELSKDDMRMVYIPEGFAHGFQTLTDNAELIYFVSAFYSPELEGGLRFDDPAIAINWPLPAGDVSAKDRNCPLIGSSFKGIKL